MFTFIVTNIFLLALATILFLAIRALPRIEEPEEAVKQNVFERWLTSGVPEKLDATLNAFLAKTLRKSKVVVLRADNYVTKHLKRIAHESNENIKPKPDFTEITGEKKTEENAPPSL